VHTDIKPENLPERAARYLDVPNMPWEPTKFPSIRIKVLYTDDTGITTALFKLEPGKALHDVSLVEVNIKQRLSLVAPRPPNL